MNPFDIPQFSDFLASNKTKDVFFGMLIITNYIIVYLDLISLNMENSKIVAWKSDEIIWLLSRVKKSQNCIVAIQGQLDTNNNIINFSQIISSCNFKSFKFGTVTTTYKFHFLLLISLFF